MTLLSTKHALRDEVDAALVDLDGVTYRGRDAIPSAPPALEQARAAGLAVLYVTNNASREPADVAAHLSDRGIAARAEDVLTAAQAAAMVLRERLEPGASVLVVGAAGLRSAVEAEGFHLVDRAGDEPAAVVQGWGPELGWRDLAEGAYAVRNGAFYLATNRDLTLPTEHGLAPGNGALVQAVVTATGVEPESSGKPEPTMFRLAADRLGAKRPLVVGDRLDTDLAGANAAGYLGLLVLTGVSQPRDLLLARPEHRPQFVGEDLACLADRHVAPERDGNAWVAGEASASVRGGRLEAAGGSRIDRLRAACAAVWEVADRGETTHIEDAALHGLW